MAEETAVRFRIETVGADRLDSESERAIASVERLAGAETKLNREAKPAATSIAKLAQEGGKTGTAAASAAPKVDKLGNEIDQTGKQAAAASRNLGLTTGELKNLGSAAGAIGGKIAGVAGAFLGFQAIRGYVSSAVRAIIEAEDAAAQLQARLRSFGTVGGQSFGDLQEEASRLSHALGIDDEAVIQLQATLGKFGAIDTPELFNRATKAAIDLAAASAEAGQTIESGFGAAAEAIGKFATEPDEALAMLERSVGRFTDEQSKLILETAKAGDEAGALTIALGILEQRIGGTSDELRDNLGGAFRAVAVEWEDLQEELGNDTGVLREWAESIAESIRWTRENLFVFRAAWLGVLEDINDGIATYLEGVASVARASRWLGNVTGGNAASDFLEGRAAELRKEADRLAALAESALDRGTGISGIFGNIPNETKNLGNSHKQLGKDMESAQAAAKKLLATLIQEESSQRAVTAAAKESSAAHKAAELARQQELKTAQIREAFLKSGLKWTAENTAEVYRLVKSLRDLKAQEDALLALPDLMMKVTIDTSSLDQAISDAEDYVATVNAEIKAVAEANQASLDEHNQAIFDDLMEQALHFKESLTTPREELARFNRLLDELGKVTDSTGKAVLSATEIEKLRADAVSEYQSAQLDTQLGLWGDFFGTLSQEFGGFFSYVSQLISNLQNAKKMGDTVTGIDQAMGGGQAISGVGAAGMSAAGTVAAVAYIWWMTYTTVNDAIKASKTRNYGAGVDYSRGNFKEGIGALDADAREVVQAIRRMIRQFEDVLRVSVSDLEQIGVRIRNDGSYVKAYVQDQMIGKFKTVDEAIAAALRIALTDSSAVILGMSDLVREGLKSFTVPDMEELMSFLSELKAINDIGLGPAAGALDAIHQLDRLWLAIEKLGSASDGAVQGMSNLMMAEVSVWQDLFDSITGRNKTQAEIRAEKERDLKVAKAELEIRKAMIQQRIIMAQAELAAAKAGNILIDGGQGGGGGGGKKGRGGLLGVAYAFALAGQTIAATTEAVTGATTGMADALAAEIKGLQDLLAALGQIVIPDIGAIGGGRGAGGGDSRDQVRDFIRDKRFELSLAGLSDYQRALRELDRTYEPLLASAGKDNQLKAELIALREKERKLIEEQRKRDLAEKFNQFMGIGQDPFSQLRKGAADLIKEIEDSPFGSERKARMIGRIFADLERQIERLSRETAAGLFGELLGDLEKYGADEQLMSQVRQQMALIEHTIKVEHYRTEIALLRAAGKLGPEVMRALDEAFAFVAGIDPTQFVAPSVPLTSAKGRTTFRGYDDDQTSNVINAQDRFGDALKRATDLLKKYTDDGLSPLQRELNTIAEDFAEIINAMGSTPTVLIEREAAITRAITKAMSGVQSAFDTITKGTLSGLTPAAQYAGALSDYERLLGELRGGNFDNLDNFASALELLSDLGSQQYGTSTGGYQDLRAKIMTEVGPLLAGTGLNLSQILAGESSGMTNTLVANNNTNADRLIVSQGTIATNLVKMSDYLGGMLSGVTAQLQLLNQNVKSGGSGLSYGS